MQFCGESISLQRLDINVELAHHPLKNLHLFVDGNVALVDVFEAICVKLGYFLLSIVPRLLCFHISIMLSRESNLLLL